jgi:nitroimidazol reductase NimA-like FMN-containing flavoprotein (pyridoxamine 5'-phosphate oxidase superfamily)
MHGSPPSARTTVRRLADRGDYDPATIRAVLDEGLVCHVGFVVDEQPFVMPMAYGRDGDHLILHGSVASRVLRALAAGSPVCVTVTLLDGLVLARSIFHHSMNYRSVVVLGRPEVVTERGAKLQSLERLAEHLAPGRWSEVRVPNDRELAKTLVLRLPLTEASAKIRRGPPKDEEEDYALPVWAGVVPFTMTAGEPEPDPRLAPGVRPSASVRSYRRRGG